MASRLIADTACEFVAKRRGRLSAPTLQVKRKILQRNMAFLLLTRMVADRATIMTNLKWVSGGFMAFGIDVGGYSLMMWA
jgi:hypothetical protein